MGFELTPICYYSSCTSICAFQPYRANLPNWHGGLSLLSAMIKRSDFSRQNTQKPLEPVAGIEPAYPAWKAGVLPLNYTGVFASLPMPNREAGETGIEPAFCWWSLGYGKPAVTNSPAGEVDGPHPGPLYQPNRHDIVLCSAGLKVPAERCLMCRLSGCQLIGVRFSCSYASPLLVENEGLEPSDRTPLLCRRRCDRTAALSRAFSPYNRQGFPPGPSVRAVMRC